MSRKGVTVIEVLFAMGVVTIGLLGVMSVIPLAMHSIGQGTQFDRASRAGQSAMREFNTRGMARADKWVRFHPQKRWSRVTWDRGFDNLWGSIEDDDGAGATFDPFDGTEGIALGATNVNEAGWLNGQRPFDLLTDYPTPGVSFCLDPRFLMGRDPTRGEPNWRVTSVVLNGNDIPVDANAFPYRVIPTQSGRETPLLKMQRISLSSGLGNLAPMQMPHSDEVFVIDDELVFEVPEESENPPRARYLQQLDNANQLVPVTQEHDGNYSWMATLVPERNQSGEYSTRYRLSIVVFFKRDPLLEMNTENERIAYIPQDAFLSDGVGGGEVTLHSYLPSMASPNPEQELAVGEGDWVLLSALIRRATSDGIEDVPYFRWYRIGSVDEPIVGEIGNWVRNVTLDGADWPYQSVRPHTTLGRDNTRVTLVNDVVAVFERTIAIETNSDRNVQ